MSIKAKLEALIYAAEEPIGLDQMAALLKHDLLALKDQPVPPGEDGPEGQLGPMESAIEEDQKTEDIPAAMGGENVPNVPEEAQRSTAAAPGPSAKKGERRSPDKSERIGLRNLLKPILEELIAEFNKDGHGIEVREVAGGYRMSTKPEHHDVVRAFAKSLKPPVRLSLPALETLAVIAYKQPATVPEISEIRGADSAGVIGTLLERKLITTAGRKSVVGRPMLYKTTKDFLVRFGLSDIGELPSIEEFEKLASGDLQAELFSTRDAAMEDATGIPSLPEDENAENDAKGPGEDGGVEQMAGDQAAVPQNVTEPTVSSDPEHTKADDEATRQIASESTGG